VIIDEQHRFGVLQRGILKKKGINPDMLVMTATPIPRTLAMTLFGDLSLSVIDELPPGRTPVDTKIYFENRRSQVYDIIRAEVKQGRQAYIIYPLVERVKRAN
jgi:ATP-dependent DNA helicase RecG